MFGVAGEVVAGTGNFVKDLAIGTTFGFLEVVSPIDPQFGHENGVQLTGRIIGRTIGLGVSIAEIGVGGGLFSSSFVALAIPGIGQLTLPISAPAAIGGATLIGHGLNSIRNAITRPWPNGKISDTNFMSRNSSNGVTNGAPESGNNLFRVVDDVELADIKKTGVFRSPAGTLEEGKQFVDNLGDVQALQKKFSKLFGGNQTIVGGQAPQSVIDNATKLPFADIPKGTAITVPLKDLPKVTPKL